MNAREQIERLLANLRRLGARRLMGLALIGLAVFAVTGLVGYVLSRPSQEVLYSGLDRQDVTRIGVALKEAGISFDISADGATVYVRYGQSAQARMLLAEKALPQTSGGYELFDKIGSLGLTSFMQEVTRVRAIEGELARTIQMMRGVKAARVHLVLGDEGSFRRAKQPPSASVVVRTGGSDDLPGAQAIRHLVAAAVPGMNVEQVTVLNVDGQLLASGGDMADGAPAKIMGLERAASREIQDAVRRTLTPYLGAKNFQASVAARLNTDKKQISETVFNPDQRVERSVRVIKENHVSQNSSSQAPVSAERNIPQDKPRGDGKQSNEDNQRREELTNYEVSTKTVATSTSGYAIDTLSIAVLVNRAGLQAMLGDKANAETMQAQIAEIEQIVGSAAGVKKDRGDVVKVSLVDFAEAGRDIEPAGSPGLVELMLRQSGSAVLALAALAATALLVWGGLRPLARQLTAPPPEPPMEPALLAQGETAEQQALPGVDGWNENDLAQSLALARAQSPRKRLEHIIDLDEERAVAVLRQWIRQGETA
jgi:flagellar M-ring protein FliF